MSERNPLGVEELELALAEVAGDITWPVTPDIAADVISTIRLQPARQTVWRPARRGLLLGLLAAVLLAGAAAALGIALGGLRIITGGPPPGTPLPAALVLERGFGQERDLDAAGAALGGLLVPDLPELGRPEHVFFDERTQAVALTWGDRDGLPADPVSGLGIVVTEFRADIRPDTFEKVLNSGTRVEPVAIGGTTAGYWIEGGEHYFLFRTEDGEVLDETIRLVSTALMWEQHGLTLRIEGAPTLEAAVRIAESMAPLEGPG
jgi:hypothetical protein